MSMGIVAESVVPWSICTVHPAAPAAADTVVLTPAVPATVLTAVPATVLTAVPANVHAAVPANVHAAVPANVPLMSLLLFHLMSHHVMLIMVAGIPYSKY